MAGAFGALPFAAAIFAVILLPVSARADFSGRVVGVTDGDTLTVVHGLKPEKIRLNGIDCPEKGQAYGRRAKELTSDLAFGKEVTAKTFGLDKYGRTIADVTLPDGANLNQELVKAGLCWWYRKYAPQDSALEKLEKEAREAKRGLWVDPNPVPPWVFRKSRRGQALDELEFYPFSAEVAPAAPQRGPPLPGETDAMSSQALYPVVGNRRSQLYHRPDCPSYSQIAAHNRVEFASARDAETAGYQLAGNCP